MMHRPACCRPPRVLRVRRPGLLWIVLAAAVAAAVFAHQARANNTSISDFGVTAISASTTSANPGDVVTTHATLKDVGGTSGDASGFIRYGDATLVHADCGGGETIDGGFLCEYSTMDPGETKNTTFEFKIGPSGKLVFQAGICQCGFGGGTGAMPGDDNPFNQFRTIVVK